jgi:uncharacterized protein involved in exopolysaccharide biosynthesis
MRNEPDNPSQPATPVARTVYMMYPAPLDDRMGVADILALFWRRKWLIAAVTAVFAVAGVVGALLATPIYRAEVVLAPASPERAPNLPAGLAGLMGLGGLSLGGSGYNPQALATLYSRTFVEEFIREQNLLPVLFADQWDAANKRWIDNDPKEQPDLREGVRFFIDEVRSIREDPETRLITVAIEWTDPEVAARWASELALRINARLRAQDIAATERRLKFLNQQLQEASFVEQRQAISRLIEEQLQTSMLARAETEYAFKVVDPARVPDRRSRPRRTLIVIFATLCGGVIGAFLSLMQSVVSDRRQNTPAAR